MLLTTAGLVLDFAGVLVLWLYAEKTTGATTHADRDALASPWYVKVGYGLLAAKPGHDVLGLCHSR
jgi:hypothetical protein